MKTPGSLTPKIFMQHKATAVAAVTAVYSTLQPISITISNLWGEPESHRG